MRNIGIFGGSFDPIHFGHLILARDAVEQFSLDRLFFVPASQAPFKEGTPPQASAEDRLAMVRTAIVGEACFDCLDVEVRTGGINYTVDTVRSVRRDWPNERLYCLVGADQAAQLDRWHAIEALAREVAFIVVDRPGYRSAPSMHQIPGLVQHRLKGRVLAISSSEIRRRKRLGLSIRYLIPETTAAYIREHNLYQQKSSLETEAPLT